MEQIIEGMVSEKGKVWEIDEIEQYLGSQEIEIDKNMMIKIIEGLIDDDIFKWLKFIGHKLPELASVDPEFLDLLKKIVNKIKRDLAQGIFVRALISIGSTNPVLGFSLYNKMVQDEDLAVYAGIPLGGATKNNFDEGFRQIIKGIENKNPIIKATSIKALRVAFENENELKKAREIFHILKRASNESEDVFVRLEATETYCEFERFNRDECVAQLKKLASQQNSHIISTLATRLWVWGLSRSEDEIDLIRICGQNENEQVLGQVSLALATKGKEHPETSMQIIEDWVKRDKYSKIHAIEYCLQEIGKGDVEKCIASVERWIETEDNLRIRFFVPRILRELCSSNYHKLIEFLRIWSIRSSKFQKIAIDTMSLVLSALHPLKQDNQELVESNFLIIEKLARAKGINVEQSIRGEQNKLFQCLKLIDELKRDREEVDFSKINAKLAIFPVFKKFFGEKWFDRKKQENNKTHPVLIILSRDFPSDEEILKGMKTFEKETNAQRKYFARQRIQNMLRPIAFLQHLETMINLVLSKTKKIKDLRTGLKNENQFWHTLSEMEVISLFMKEYPVEIAPRVGRKKLDVQVEIQGTKMLIEVIDPQMFKPLRFLSGRAIGIPTNRAKNKIHHEIKKHLKGVHLDKNVPIIIAIDIGGTEIGYDSVEESLDGSVNFKILLDKKTGDVVESYPHRANDSLHHLDNQTDILSAVICYQRVLGSDMRYHFEGKILPNKHAINPLDSELVKKIERVFFN
jgi:hypothetical protein